MSLAKDDKLGFGENNEFKVSNQLQDSELKLKTNFQDMDFAKYDTKSEKMNHKKTLVLDLDETLIHSGE